QALKPELSTYLDASDLDITFSVSSKLPVSGHSWEETIKPDVLLEYYWAGTTYLKWVIATEEDMADVQKAIELYREGFNEESPLSSVRLEDIPIYLMPVGGTAEGYFLNNKR